MHDPYSVLVVDDEEPIRRLLVRELVNDRRMVHTAVDAKSARQELRSNQYDIIVLDIRLPDADGLELFTEFKAALPDAEVILITGHGSIDHAVEAMRMGAYDYITKPFALDRLELMLDRAYQRVFLQRENKRLRHSQENERPALPLIGRSGAITHVHYLLSKVAPTNVPVLITGESGVGKDVVARNLHAQSNRADRQLIIKNCAMLQRELVRSELFGHKRGAFTGAAEAKDGLMSLAQKGTLFLDEIGDLPEDVQASLLRVLESKRYRRVGDNEERQADIRFLFATNRNLAEEVANGRFNEALFHRINVFNIHIPPLKERKEDIPLLVEHFLARLCVGHDHCTISASALTQMVDYDWPGNVRELRNVIERSIILSENGAISNQLLPREMAGLEMHGEDPSAEDMTLETMEQNHIRRILNLHGGSRQKAARALGIGRKTLYRKIQKYALLPAHDQRESE
ncbi:sigma-54-dependent transcriptional regulator [Salidesulfovibrio onnuriiensis]|uniref:sigma-54-dependent transcriptional regulator n=1 Tax=Salidesulfovibrio onnuriiensis TaxID=2583823 RepID=UPI0011CCB6F2|nr:sigma-54 dependent transcriptional regulator [Salidesulfovibrio onnuriiensis]